MIFHKLKCIFMHNERTSGVSIRKHLLQYETDFKRIANTKHLTVDETKEIVGDLWENYLTFGFVRNPYDRLVSWYYACKKNKDVWKSDLAIHVNKCDSFEELTYNPHPKMLISQYDKVKNVDFLGRFENRAQDFNKLCIMLDIPFINNVENASDHKHYRDYYSKEMVDIVSKWYEKDLKEFGYEF